jgi:hypothetical protein
VLWLRWLQHIRKFDGAPVIAVISGGNIDPDVYARLLKQPVFIL